MTAQVQSHFCKVIFAQRRLCLVVFAQDHICTGSPLHRVIFAQNNFLKITLCKYKVIFGEFSLQSLSTETSIHPYMFKGYPLWSGLWVENILSRVKSVLRGPYRNRTLCRDPYIRKTPWAYAKQFLCKLASAQSSS